MTKDFPPDSAPDALEEGGVATSTKVQKSWKVILHNDEDHTYDYVVSMLVAICQMSRSQAFRCAVEVDLTGRTIVFYGKRDEAEKVSAKINTWGPDHRMLRSRTSMESSVEGM